MYLSVSVHIHAVDTEKRKKCRIIIQWHNKYFKYLKR